jgi:hypothetical protein
LDVFEAEQCSNRNAVTAKVSQNQERIASCCICCLLLSTLSGFLNLYEHT